jgi:hypothetical protein
VPGNLVVDEGFALFFKAHAIGTQNYLCAPAANGFAWRQIEPQATLFQTFPRRPQSAAGDSLSERQP